jgi:hypothetical protein
MMHKLGDHAPIPAFPRKRGKEHFKGASSLR